MAPRPKRPTKPEARPATALDTRQLALAEEERKLKEKMARMKKVIEDAPRIAAERVQAQREELVRRAGSVEKRRLHLSALPDPRHLYEANVAVPAQHKRMRAERRQGRLTFFILLLALAAAILYLYYTVTLG